MRSGDCVVAAALLLKVASSLMLSCDLSIIQHIAK